MKKILYISLLLLFSISCDRTEPHFQQDEELIIPEQDQGKDPNKGVVVGFNTDGVSSTAINDLHIFFFDESEMLSRHSYHTDMEEIALQKMLMESGAYTLFSIFNTEEGLLDALTRSEQLPPLSLSQLIDQVNGYYEDDTYPEMLTGMTRHEVGSSIDQVIITVTDEPVTDNTTLLTLNLNYPSRSFIDYEVNTLRTRSATATPTLRVVVDFYQKGTQTRVARKSAFAQNIEGQKYKTDIYLTNGDYDVVVWSDYTTNDKEDLYYNTSSMQGVVAIAPYSGSTDYKECFYGKSTTTINGSEQSASLEVTMERPLAKYQIIANDVDEFLRKTDSEGGEYTAKFSYGFYLPTGFNVINESTIASLQGVSFTAPITIEENDQNEALLGWDFVFVNGADSFVVLNIEVADSRGEVVSQIRGLQVPYKRGHLTTLRADILTNEMEGGIDIDTEWDEEDFDLDDLLGNN